MQPCKQASRSLFFNMWCDERVEVDERELEGVIRWIQSIVDDDEPDCTVPDLLAQGHVFEYGYDMEGKLKYKIVRECFTFGSLHPLIDNSFIKLRCGGFAVLFTTLPIGRREDKKLGQFN